MTLNDLECPIHPKMRLVPKSATLDDLERPKRTMVLSGAEKMPLFEPTAQIWMKIDPYMQRQKCRPMTVVSGNIRYMRILMRTFVAGFRLDHMHRCSQRGGGGMGWKA